MFRFVFVYTARRQALPIGRATMKEISVVLVDNEPVRQAGFRSVLATAPDMSVIATYDDVPSALRNGLSSGRAADVVLMASGGRLARMVSRVQELGSSFSTSGVVVVRNLRSRYEADCLLAAGACGCIGPDVTECALLGAVMIAATGGSVFAPPVPGTTEAESLDGDLETEPDADAIGLTSREREVLGLLSIGMSNRSIAGHLTVSENTVKKHVSEALRKTGQPDRFNAGLYARRHGLYPDLIEPT
jgi:DNA-binding NarL/FixJ family response regulator